MSDSFEFSSKQEPLNLQEGENLTILQEQALFLQDISELISTVVNLRQADSERHAYEFMVLPFTSDFQFPRALKPIESEIDSITVHIGDSYEATSPNETDIPPFISIDFETGDAVYTLSRTGMSEAEEPLLNKLSTSGYQHSEPEESFIKRLETVDQKVTVKEFNSLLLSIVMPNKAGDYEAYAHVQLQTADAFSSLCELMQDRSLQYTSSYEFDLQDEESTLYFTRENSQITSFTFIYFDSEQNRPLRVEYDNMTDLNLRFFSDEESEKTPIIPTTKEINYVRRVIGAELSSIDTIELGQAGDIEAPIRPSASEIEFNAHIKESVEKILKNLGLDSPNAGT